MSGIVNARSGSWLTVTTGHDIAATGISAQRVNQVSDDAYGDKTLNNYLNPAAFAYPATVRSAITLINSIEGPGFWTVDLAVSRLVSLTGRAGLELRVEAFNLLNNFNWGNPATNYDPGSSAGSPRWRATRASSVNKYGF